MPIEKTTATILRKDEQPYIAMSREVIQAIRQAEALSIWVYLQSKPQNWVIRKTDIKNSLGLGPDRYKKGMDLLKEMGLITTSEVRGCDGKLGGKVLWCHASPVTEVPENRTSGKPNVGKTERRENRTLKEVQINKDLQITKEVQIPSYINPDLWSDFMDQRKSLKAKNTERAIKVILSRLEEFRAKGHDPNRVIENSIENSWKGVFEPKGKAIEKTNGNLSAIDKVRAANRAKGWHFD